MSWVKDAIAGLKKEESVKVRPHGGSMRGRIESGQLVTLVPVDGSDVAVDDMVFIRWKGNYLLHIVKQVGDQGLLIGNNLGKINGWASPEDVLARVIKVED